MSVKRKCPIHGVEMKFVATTVNGNDGLSEFWYCDGGNGPNPRGHIVMVEEWGAEITYYAPEKWEVIKYE